MVRVADDIWYSLSSVVISVRVLTCILVHYGTTAGRSIQRLMNIHIFNSVSIMFVCLKIKLVDEFFIKYVFNFQTEVISSSYIPIHLISNTIAPLYSIVCLVTILRK